MSRRRSLSNPLVLSVLIMTIILLLIGSALIAHESVMASSLQSVISGNGAQYAPTYDPAKQGPHRVVIVVPHNYDIGIAWVGSWNYPPSDQSLVSALPRNWLARFVWEAELVAFVTGREVTLGKATYTLTSWTGGRASSKNVTVTRYRLEKEVVLREARTGRLVAQSTLVGGEPPPFTETVTSQYLYGSDPIDQLERWLHPFVMGVTGHTP